MSLQGILEPSMDKCNVCTLPGWGGGATVCGFTLLAHGGGGGQGALKQLKQLKPEPNSSTG